MAKAVDKLAAVTAVSEPADVQYGVDTTMWTYGFQGQTIYTYDFGSRMTDLRLFQDTTQASTVEIDMEDNDFNVLDDPLFNHWAFDIQDVSLDTAKKFKPTRLTNSVSTAYLGDSADLEWVLGRRPIDYEIGDVAFRMVGMTSQQTTITLTFEDRVASLLRDFKGHKSWDRSSHTRADFVAMLCREAGVDFWIPEINVAQPVQVDPNANTNADPKNPNGKGLSRTANLTVFGHAMTETQKHVAEILLGEAHRLSAPLACYQAILYAGIGETKLGALASTYTNNSSGAIGVLQGTNTYWDSHPHDTATMADNFLQGGRGFNSAITLAKSGITDMAEIAVKVEVPSIWPNNAYANEAGWNDQQVRDEVGKIIAAYGGPVAKDSGPATNSGTYSFTRGVNEDSWDCIQRLASEVAWYAFVRQNRLWFVSGNYLFSQRSQMTVERGRNGIDYIDMDLDIGARDQIAQCTVSGRTSLWSALPGMVVEVLKRGPATGKWMVSQLQSHPLDQSQGVQITLQKPVPERAEPADTTQSTRKQAKASTGTKVDTSLYSNPVPWATSTNAARIDMGVDYSGSGPLHAIGDGKITNIYNSGWPGGVFIELLLSNGKFQGKSWYYAENITPNVKVNQVVNAGDVIGYLKEGYPYLEMGWGIGTGGTTLAAHLGQDAKSSGASGDPGAWESAAGASANRLLVSLGAPSGTGGSPIGGGPHGRLPAGYP